MPNKNFQKSRQYVQTKNLDFVPICSDQHLQILFRWPMVATHLVSKHQFIWPIWLVFNTGTEQLMPRGNSLFILKHIFYISRILDLTVIQSNLNQISYIQHDHKINSDFSANSEYFTFLKDRLGNSMGNPGVSQANPYPYSSDPYPQSLQVYPSK